MMEDGTPLQIGDRVQIRTGALRPEATFRHYDVMDFVVTDIDRSREADGDSSFR
jgi:hypothetical protein